MRKESGDTGSEKKGTPMTGFEARPTARMNDLLSTELASGEVIVFDKQRNCAHCLNPAAAAVWRLRRPTNGSGSLRSSSPRKRAPR
jgi:hypothetical protein